MILFVTNWTLTHKFFIRYFFDTFYPKTNLFSSILFHFFIHNFFGDKMSFKGGRNDFPRKYIPEAVLDPDPDLGSVLGKMDLVQVISLRFTEFKK